jgi:integrase
MPGRRGNGEGSISKRPDGRWEARITVEGGKRKSFFAKNRQDAARKLTEALRDRDKGLPFVGERQTVGQFLTSWIETVGSTIEPTTLRMYSIRVRRHIIPAIGKVSLAKLTPQRVQQLYSDKLKEGLSTTTVHHIHTVLSHALSDALRLGLVMSPRWSMRPASGMWKSKSISQMRPGAFLQQPAVAASKRFSYLP